MSALVFLVRGRGVDLVAMTARHALRETMGLGGEVVDLQRDDLVIVEGVREETGWLEAFTARQHWFNPNKHRYALARAKEGAFAAARGGSWPQRWLERVVATDRPDLDPAVDDVFSAWLGLPAHAGCHAVPLAVYDRAEPIAPLAGRWPQSGGHFLRATLWTLVLRLPEAEAAARRAAEIAITRRRGEGLLVNPHMEGWAMVARPRRLDAPGEVAA